MWIMVHDTLEEHGIDTILAHPYKTRIIAEARVKNDRLDSRILSDLLRTNMVYESLRSTKGVQGEKVSHPAARIAEPDEVRDEEQDTLDPGEVRLQA